MTNICHTLVWPCIGEASLTIHTQQFLKIWVLERDEETWRNHKFCTAAADVEVVI